MKKKVKTLEIKDYKNKNDKKQEKLSDIFKNTPSKELIMNAFLKELNDKIGLDNFYFLTHYEIGNYAVALVPLNKTEITDKSLYELLETESELVRFIDLGQQVDNQIEFVDALRYYGKFFNC